MGSEYGLQLEGTSKAAIIVIEAPAVKKAAATAIITIRAPMIID